MRKTFQHLRIEDIQSFYELVIYNFSFQEVFCVLISICEKSHLLKWVLIIHSDCNMRLVMYWYNFQALGLTVLTVLANQEFDFWGPLRTADSYSTRSVSVSYVKQCGRTEGISIHRIHTRRGQWLYHRDSKCQNNWPSFLLVKISNLYIVICKCKVNLKLQTVEM